MLWIMSTYTRRIVSIVIYKTCQERKIVFEADVTVLTGPVRRTSIFTMVVARMQA